MNQNAFQEFTVRVKRGEAVFNEGEKGRTMFIVQSGTIGLYQQTNGSQHLLNTMEKGDFFGEMSILEGLPRTTSALAEQDAELIEINHTVFDKMIRANIEIAVRMLRKLSIRLRETEARVAELQSAGPRAASGARASAERGRAATTAVCTGARLEVDGQRATFPLTESTTLVGRLDPVTHLTPDIDLTDFDLKRTVSRQHARIVKTSEGFAVVEEAGALHGTFVNETRLTAGQVHPLHDGDRLSFGSVCVLFRT